MFKYSDTHGFKLVKWRLHKITMKGNGKLNDKFKGQYNLHKKYIYLSADNYIEKELLGNLYNAMTKRYENIVVQLQNIVATLVGKADLKERQLALLTIKKYILLEKHYIKSTTLEKDRDLPKNENSGLVLKWFDYVKIVMFRSVPCYYKNLSLLASRYYSATGNNKYKNEYKINCRFMESKFTTILNLIQSEIFSDYIDTLGNLEKLVETYEPILFDNSNSELEKCREIEHTVENVTLENMYNYRDLNELASSYDFIKVGQTGSHAQFKHSDGRLITIPQGRDIGKGLSIKIQKDIKTDRLNERNKEIKSRRMQIV